MTKFCHTRVNITVNVTSEHIKNIRCSFYQRFILPLESWNPFSRAYSAASGLGLCTHNVPNVPMPVTWIIKCCISRRETQHPVAPFHLGRGRMMCNRLIADLTRDRVMAANRKAARLLLPLTVDACYQPQQTTITSYHPGQTDSGGYITPPRHQISHGGRVRVLVTVTSIRPPVITKTARITQTQTHTRCREPARPIHLLYHNSLESLNAGKCSKISFLPTIILLLSVPLTR